MLFPIGTDRPQERIPWMNILLIAANIVVYILSHQTDATQRLQTAGLDTNWFRFILDPTPRHMALVQFISYQFLHKDLGHIFGNMLFLYVFGNGVNDKLGHAGYLAFYLAGGIIAGCGQVLSNSGPTLGASGSVSAITGIFFVLLLRTNIRLVFFVIPFYIESMYVILFSFFRDVLERTMGMGQVAYTAHITGTISGFAIGLLLLGAGLVRHDQYDLMTVVERWRRRRQYEAIVAGHGARLPLPGLTPPAAAPLLLQQIVNLIAQRRLQEAAQKYLELKSIGGNPRLSGPDLLDIGNQLAADNRFEEAALAYEDFLRRYSGAPHTEEVHFILGMILARMGRRAEAIDLLEKALPLLADAAQRRTAETTLRHLRGQPTAL